MKKRKNSSYIKATMICITEESRRGEGLGEKFRSTQNF